MTRPIRTRVAQSPPVRPAVPRLLLEYIISQEGTTGLSTTSSIIAIFPGSSLIIFFALPRLDTIASRRLEGADAPDPDGSVRYLLRTRRLLIRFAPAFPASPLLGPRVVVPSS